MYTCIVYGKRRRFLFSFVYLYRYRHGIELRGNSRICGAVGRREINLWNIVAECWRRNKGLIEIFCLQSSKLEEALTQQLQGLRDQCNLKKSSLQDHQSSLEVLKEEVSSSDGVVRRM